jgi:hypothetical protein
MIVPSENGGGQSRAVVGSFRSARFSDNANSYMASISDNKKSRGRSAERVVPQSAEQMPKPRGRPVTTGTGQMLGVRLQPDQLAALDAWIARCPEPKPSRPEAVRRILAGALGSDSPSSPVVHEVTGRDIV